MDFFSLLTLAHDLGEPKPENYAKSFTATTNSSQEAGVASHFQNHHNQQQAEGLASSSCASSDPTEYRSEVNGYSENGFCGPQGTKRTRGGHSNGLEDIAYFTEDSSVPAKVISYIVTLLILLFGRTFC